MKYTSIKSIVLILTVLAAVGPSTVRADPIADFYRMLFADLPSILSSRSSVNPASSPFTATAISVGTSPAAASYTQTCCAP